MLNEELNALQCGQSTGLVSKDLVKTDSLICVIVFHSGIYLTHIYLVLVADGFFAHRELGGWLNVAVDVVPLAKIGEEHLDAVVVAREVVGLAGEPIGVGDLKPISTTTLGTKTEPQSKIIFPEK